MIQATCEMRINWCFHLVAKFHSKLRFKSELRSIFWQNEFQSGYLEKRAHFIRAEKRWNGDDSRPHLNA